MAFLDQFKINEIKKNTVDDLSQLGKIYRSKKNEYQLLSVDHSLVDGYLEDGWETYDKPLKTKTKLRMKKPYSKRFEDDVWCQFYELGFRRLNFDENFVLPFSNELKDTKQIDVVAINNETVFLIECKSSEKPKKAPSYKDEFDVLSMRIDGFKKVMQQAYGKNIKVKYIFATRNLRLDPESDDMHRFKKTKSFYYNNNTYDYVTNLIKHYKDAAIYQFLGLVFKNDLINTEKIEIPAVKGSMGKKDYYMFSIEPSLVLKMGFILHRTKANEAEFPTYQRLLVPSRLASISKFIEDGGYFPNSVILNFNSTKKNSIEFQSTAKKAGSSSCYGTLKIPNSYGIAYIIDGQHRIYGYAYSSYKESNTIPCVAFENLTTIEQLEMFMEINQNQKAVAPSLRLDLEEDLYWESDRADSRLKALRSSIIKELANNSQTSPLFGKISVGEDKALLTFPPFTKAFIDSGLLPIAKGNKYKEESIEASLYDVNNHNHNEEMLKTKMKISKFIILCYEFVEEGYPDIFNKDKYFIVSNRGTYAFIALIGSLNKHETSKGNLNKSTSPNKRFEAINKYLISLFDHIKGISKEEEDAQLQLLGASADTKWLRFFQDIINKKHPDYDPVELIDWRERQNEDLQDEGRKYGVAIEKKMKAIVLDKIKNLYGDDWELEINSIKRACQDRAEQEMEKKYKDGLGREEVLWTEMFNINDYKTIITKYWGKEPEDSESNFSTFEDEFSIDIDEGFHTRAEKLKWISHFNSHRNLWAHEGTKEKRLNKAEVAFLEKVHAHFYE